MRVGATPSRFFEFPATSKSGIFPVSFEDITILRGRGCWGEQAANARTERSAKAVIDVIRILRMIGLEPAGALLGVTLSGVTALGLP
jgi:hypothetical protein